MNLMQIKEAIRNNDCASWKQHEFNAHIEALTKAKKDIARGHIFQHAFWSLLIAIVTSASVTGYVGGYLKAIDVQIVGGNTSIAVVIVVFVALLVAKVYSMVIDWRSLIEDYDEIIGKLDVITIRVRLANEQPPQAIANPAAGRVDMIKKKWDGNLDPPKP